MRGAVTIAFVAAVATIDFSPLSVYRYLLVSDALLLGALLLEWTRRRSPELFVPTFVMGTFGLYLGGTLLSFARAVDPASGVFTWLHSVFLMLVYVPAATTLMTLRPDLRALVPGVVLAAAALQGLVVAAEVASGLDWRTGTRIAGAFGSIQLWSYAAGAVAALAIVMNARRLSHRLWALAAALPLAAAEVFLRSRMLWIATILGCSLFALVQARRKGLAAAGVLAGLVGLAAAYAAGLYPPAIEARIADVLNPSRAADLQARLYVATSALQQIASSPLIGTGTGQAPLVFSEQVVPPVVVTVHNIVLHASMEGGLLAGAGLALLPIGVLLLWRQAVTVGQRVEHFHANWSLATLVSLYLAAQLTPTLFEHLFYFLVAYLASVATAGAPARRSVEAQEFAPSQPALGGVAP